MAKKKNSKDRVRRRRGESGSGNLHPTGILKSFAAVCAVGAVVLGIVYWDRMIKETGSASEDTVTLEIRAVPAWVNEALKEKLSAVARADGIGLQLDDAVAGRVQRNIQELFAWLDGATVRTMHDRLVVEGRWRKPVVFVKQGLESFYVDGDLVVLDFVEMPHLTITNVQGLTPPPAGPGREGPALGQVWQRDDLAAAVELVELLGEWDRQKTPDKPLLDEIAAVDVSNYDGRTNSRSPHILFYTTDNTEVIWGAEPGKWQRHLEADDAEKLAKLYAYYKEHGTLLGEVKYINLRDPQDKIHLPIDKY
ncbi:MAG TPA: hypothetical protein VJJ98_07870 [Sedimentisphaerales bacterium]|nr:hypothetical protein [Sedimentisphaerales bacterium]